MPSSGPQAGGHLVRVLGSGFEDLPSLTCWFGNTSTRGHFITEHAVACTTAAGLGLVLIGVTNFPADRYTSTSEMLPAYIFTSKARIASIVPNHGPPSGTQKVSVFGINLPRLSSCAFTDTDSGPATWFGPGLVFCSAPALSLGVALLTLRVQDPEVYTVHGLPFVIEPQLTVLSISPALGPAQGGTIVTIIGQHFRTGCVCSFKSDPTALDVVRSVSSVLQSSTMLCASPPLPLKTDTLLLLVGSTDADTLNRGNGYVFSFQYQKHCQIEAVTPSAGPEAGGSLLQIIGSNLLPAEDPLVFFGPSTTVRGVVVNSTMVRVALLRLEPVDFSHHPATYDIG